MTGGERLAKVAEVLRQHPWQVGYGGCPCGWQGSESQDEQDEHAAHVAEALAPLLDTFRTEDEARALREARDALYRGEGPDMFADSDIVYGEWLGNRADRIGGDA